MAILTPSSPRDADIHPHRKMSFAKEMDGPITRAFTLVSAGLCPAKTV
jgi:hypothetical protein